MAGRWTLLLSYWTTRARRFRVARRTRKLAECAGQAFPGERPARLPFYRAWVGDRPLDTPDGAYARRYLTPFLRDGIRTYVANAHLQILSVDDAVLGWATLRGTGS